jgi:hypothetical protein
MLRKSYSRQTSAYWNCATEEGIVKRDPSHLIVWRENDRIVGDTIWHEENIDEFTGDPARAEVWKVILARDALSSRTPPDSQIVARGKAC